MEIFWQARNLELTNGVKQIVEGKINRLGKRLPALSKAEVEVTREGTRSRLDQIITEITLNGAGLALRAEERAPDVLTGVDAAIKTLQGRIRHLKGKLYRSQAPTHAARVEQATAAGRAAPQEENPEVVVRVKRFAMKPMTVEEAVTQMELLGHGFFFFKNTDTGDHAVVYRRRDGAYALIAPDG